MEITTSSSSRRFAPAAEPVDYSEEDEAVHAADGLESFYPDGQPQRGQTWGLGTSNHQQPYSSYPTSAVPSSSTAFFTRQQGVIGRDPPRELLRVERDYTTGDIAQFHTTYPLELEGRISPTKFQETLNDINDALLGANSFGWAVFDNCLMVATFHLSLLVRTSHFEKEINRLEALIESKNQEVWEPAGLRLRSPRKVAFMFLEIEYY